ncbi:MAG TPA: asparagine synthase-related protein [Candidatus Krumholzibacteria bacterium]|nr:asparagine synthase-related protein [Candidatus Krumholzibacteria bacterium]HPD70444.1 asparagine synthase-related protein [Candidatus Krumholzibacteria bacterium]HRY39856.1 asparagine synthase-related protein [Candidatus Krumholzibacteria bacterium]
MPGIFALQLPPGYADGAVVADRLAAAMTLFPWQSARVEEVLPERLFLGVITDRDRGPGAAGCRGRAGAVSCVVEGHIVRSRSDCNAEAPLAAGDYAEAVLRAYTAHGPTFAEHLEGQYGVLLVDRASRRLLAAHGRIGEKPLYFARRDGATLFCSQLGPMAACGLWRAAIDPDAVATFLTYGQQFATRTLLAGVDLMDTATICEVDLESGALRKRRYWTLLEAGPLDEARPLRQHVRELSDEVVAAARRAVRRQARYVAGLSGGADTRLMAGAAAPLVDGLAAWTLGAPGSSDVIVASQVARHLGLEHWTFSARPDLVPEFASEFVATSDGALPADWAYANGRARELRDRGAGVVLTGYAGECFLRGDFLTLRFAQFKPYARHRLGIGPAAPHPVVERNRGSASVAHYIAVKYGKRGPLSRLAGTEPPDLRDTIEHDLTTLYDGMAPSAQVDEWVLEQRGRRRTLVATNSDRHFYSDGSIFYDYDLLDRCTVVPPRHKRFNRLFNGVMNRLMPDLGRLVSGNTGLPMTAPYWRFATRELVARVVLRREPAISTGMNVDAWVRDELREFYGDLLHDARTRARTYWNGEGIAALFDAHQSGAERVGAALGLPVTVELFARRWVDAPWTPRPPAAERVAGE